jgi:hypothetical protein
MKMIRPTQVYLLISILVIIVLAFVFIALIANGSTRENLAQKTFYQLIDR